MGGGLISWISLMCDGGSGNFFSQTEKNVWYGLLGYPSCHGFESDYPRSRGRGILGRSAGLAGIICGKQSRAGYSRLTRMSPRKAGIEDWTVTLSVEAHFRFPNANCDPKESPSYARPGQAFTAAIPRAGRRRLGRPSRHQWPEECPDLAWRERSPSQ